MNDLTFRSNQQDSTEDSSALRILVIEDDPDSQANLADLLELDGHEAICAGSLSQAIELAKTSNINAIILDRQLPDGDSYASLDVLSKCAPQAPIVVVTGLPDVDGAIAALRRGAYDYILKPISADVLRASLRRISERHNTIEELRRQRDFADRLIETAQSIVVVLDTEARIVRCNSFLAELTGYQSSELVGQDWFDTFIPGTDHTTIRSVFTRAVSGERIHANTNPILTRGGELKEISWWATALINDSGDITGVLSVGHDLTELRSAEQRVVQSERLAAIGQMVTGLAHESRNAFQRSQACLDMLTLEIEDNTEARELITKIQKALDHLHHLYEEVRDYAAPITLGCQEEDLRDVWRETWNHLEIVRRNADVRIYERDTNLDLVCEIDRHAMVQVFRNIFENAIAACPSPGEITVKCRASTLAGTDALEIRIADNGDGIGKKLQSQIFDPFFTTKTKGTGLGLAIVRRLVDAHNGTIRVGDGESGGAEFTIVLPRTFDASISRDHRST